MPTKPATPLAALLAHLEAETDLLARARAIDEALSQLEGLRVRCALAGHDGAVRAALTRWIAGDDKAPRLAKADALEVARLRDELRFAAVTYEHGADGTISSRVEAVVAGQRFTAQWRYNYAAEQSEWQLRGAFVSDGEECFFSGAAVRAKKGLTTLSKDAVRYFAYLCAFDHLHGARPHSFYHRPAWQ